MEHLRVKLKFGDLEFEAEGPGQDVHAQFASLRELLQPASATRESTSPQEQAVTLPDELVPPGNEIGDRAHEILVHEHETAAPPDEPVARQDEPVTPPPEPVAPPQMPITSAMRLEGRIVSLIKAPQTIEDGILLALLGQKLLRNNEKVMGGDIITGITRSGRPVQRIDYRTHKLVNAGDVVAIGRGRAARYRLTAAGHAKAEALARAALAAPGAMA